MIKDIISNVTKNKVEVMHPAVGIKGGHLYYGFTLPKNTETINKEINIFTKKKKRKPVVGDIELFYRGVLTDEYKIIMEDEFLKEGYIIMGEINSDNGFVSPTLVINTYEKKIKTVKIKELYEKIKIKLQKYIYYQNEEEYDIVILYIIGSMFYTTFNYYPILHFFADMGSGKTISGKFIQKLGFNGYYTNNITKAALTRELNNRKGVIIVDEKENINNNEELKYILNSCYSKGAQESLTESIQPGVWKSISLMLFAPVVICSINPIYGATSDRIIRIDMIRMKKSQPQSKTDLISDFDDKEWDDYKDDLVLYAFQNWREVKKEYEKYNNDDLKVSNRALDIFKPLLCISRLCDKKIEEGLIQYINKIYIENKTENIMTDYMYKTIEQLNNYQDKQIINAITIFNDIKLKIEEVDENAKYTLRMFGAMMKKIGYSENNKNKIREKGSFKYKICHKTNNDYLERYYFKDEIEEVKEIVKEEMEKN